MMKVFACRDVKAEAFLPPFFMNTNGEAVRAFVDEVNREGSNFGKYPEDFTLFRIGEYDQATALLTAEVQPVPLMSAQNALVVTVPLAVKASGTAGGSEW